MPVKLDGEPWPDDRAIVEAIKREAEWDEREFWEPLRGIIKTLEEYGSDDSHRRRATRGPG